MKLSMLSGIGGNIKSSKVFARQNIRTKTSLSVYGVHVDNMHRVLFKKRPKEWNGYQRIIDFASFMKELPLIALKESVRQQQQIIEDQNKKIETQAGQIKKINEEIESLTRQLKY